MTDNILIIGSGGREHALAWRLSQSPRVKEVFVAPGNAGTHLDTSGKVTNVGLNIKNNEQIAEWCKDKKIDLVVVGPEDPLANGIADYLNKHKVKCFGPNQKAAQIEASKEFAKSFMDRHHIPTAKWKSFTNAEDAEKHILSASYNALVVKASGLAAGKGVIVASSKEDAVKAVHSLKEDKGLSSACETIVIEELLEGEETSVLCFSDGTNISVMPPAQDHKRLLDNDEGPNTGGMGAYCRCMISDDTLNFIQKNILQKAVDGMKTEGYSYIGVLYAGLMMTKDGPKVLEFNCRFGDPETQVILPLLNSDLYEVMLACVNGSLDKMAIQWFSTKFAVGVVVVSGGYPGSYPKGKVITGLDKLPRDYIVFHAGTAVNDNTIVTSGGRVLAVVALEDTLEKAASKAKKGASQVNFDGAFYRNDIAHKALKRAVTEGLTYKSSGVDIENADALVDKIKSLTKQTLRPGVCGGIGGFGGIFDLKAANYNDSYLVSRGSGIGEKLMALQDCNNYESIGYDLVSNCVNEILSQGAEPLFFLDTYTTGKLDTIIAAKVIQGIVKGCKESNCVLIGGETAEMPGMYADGDFDLTGFARGAVNKEKLLPHTNKISGGDFVIALASSSINASSYGIVRRILRKEGLTLESPAPFANNISIKECVIVQNKIHVQSVLPLMKKDYIKAAAYINEGGISENVRKILPSSYRIALDASRWTIPSVFSWMAKVGQFSENEMLENFNCGIDMILVVDKDLKTTVLDSLKAHSEEAVVIGSVQACEEGDKKVEILNSPFIAKEIFKKIKLAIFTSGQAAPGTEALIDYTHNLINTSTSEVALVVSDSNISQGILKAKEKNIPTKVFDPKDFNAIADSRVQDYLKANSIQLICLDNFSSQLSNSFVESWQGKILSIHLSLLPAFDTPEALKEMLSMKVRITGCTVFFYQPGNKFGGIIEQVATFVEPDEDEETLHKKVTKLQQYVYPKAVELVASKRVVCGADNKLQCVGDDFLVTNSAKSNHAALNTKINSLVQSTARAGLVDVHSLCGVFDLKASGYEDPYLVSGTDGVGTKLKIAQICNKHETIGIDLVAMCVNDILTHGAEPLFFMQCFNCGKLNPDIVSDVISGIVNGCKQANCALINSEISVLPDIYLDKKKCIPDFENYDVVGYAEGALEKDNLLPRLSDIKENDVLIGLESSGIHSNGYSLVRKLVTIRNLRYQDPAPFDPTKTLGEALLTPTKIYVKSLLTLMKKGYVKAAAHITGGGLTENIPRVLPNGYKVVLDGEKWSVPSVLKWIAGEGHLSDKEMLKTFNCGLGMILIVNKEHEKKVLDHLKVSGEKASNIGYVKLQTEGEEKVEVRKFSLNAQSTRIKRKRVGVLISGSGTNLQALIDYTQNPSNQSKAEIVLVISNVPGVEGLKRAERANIPTKVLSHKGFKSRVEFDMAVNDILQENGIEIICLAGFMRILSKKFVQIWQGRLLNVHPAILPAFKGMNAHKQVLETGARITGCTVHFVEPEVDAGAIIEQAAVRVDINDSEKSLQEKVKVLEHQIFPTSLELLASEKISRGQDGKLIWHY